MRTHVPNMANVKIIDDAVVEILRRKTTVERRAMCFAANRGMRLLVEAAVRKLHPDLPDDQVQREAGKQMLAMCDD